MKRNIMVTIFILLIFNYTKAQKYCSFSFEAYSKERSVYCEYCNKSYKFIIPTKIKYNKKDICNIMNNPSSATDEAKCKFNSLNWYITYLYFKGWYDGNAFADEKCSSINNPSHKHSAYQGKDRNIGLKQFSYTEYEVESYFSFMEDAKQYIDYGSYLAGKRTAASWALSCLSESCNTLDIKDYDKQDNINSSSGNESKKKYTNSQNSTRGADNTDTHKYEESLKEKWKRNGKDEYEGIYEIISNKDRKYRVALIQIYKGFYKMFYINGAPKENSNNWNVGDLKATLISYKINDTFNTTWYTNDKTELKNQSILITSNGFILTLKDKNINEKNIFSKIY